MSKYNKSKSIGKNFEKKISKIIGEWWCGQKSSFFCSIGSGSRSTTLPGQGLYAGDVVPVKDIGVWPLCIEVKHTQSWSFQGFLQGNQGEQLYQYMGQCLQQALGAINPLPVLICASNNHKPIVFVQTYLFARYVPEFVRLLPLWMRLRVRPQAMPESVTERFPGALEFDFVAMELGIFLEQFTREHFIGEFERQRQVKKVRGRHC